MPHELRVHHVDGGRASAVVRARAQRHGAVEHAAARDDLLRQLVVDVHEVRAGAVLPAELGALAARALVGAARGERAPVGLLGACEERDYKGLHAFPSKITRDDHPITKDPSLILWGESWQRREGLQGITRLSF